LTAVKVFSGPVPTLATTQRSRRMTTSVPHRHLWSPERLSRDDLEALLETASALKRAQQLGHGWDPLRGCHLASLCDRYDEATLAFQRAVHDLGGSVALLDAHKWQSSAAQRVPEAARMLGRLYDAIDCCGVPAQLLEQIDAHCGVPVFNGVAQANHPLGLLAAFLTMREAGDKPLNKMHMQLTGDAQAPQSQAAAVLARLAGIEVLRDAAMEAPHRAASATNDAPDFILDPLGTPAPVSTLTTPEATAEGRARIAALLASNRQRALQAALVCGMQ
jgi:ornithine carbamoyltransferase